MIISIAVISTVISLASIGFFRIFKENLDIARTGTFMILILLEFISVFIVRADYEVKFLSNKRIFISIIGAFLLTFGVIYIPQLANIFKLTALTIQEWKVIVCL
ncbi:MAG: cation transporting ATPase C-terminal domain-containing protein [Patescibacteria group bacterium]|nr:cation transporting ATPase C-terminal domain-containing protein [Patescibacteria group bacterium]